MNQQVMMRKLMKMKQEMEDTQKEIYESEFSASAGGIVTVTVLGTKELVKVEVAKKRILDINPNINDNKYDWSDTSFTLFNLLIGLNGYTICSGIISEELNGKDIVSIELDVEDSMNIGFITRKNTKISRLGEAYIEALKKHIYGLL